MTKATLQPTSIKHDPIPIERDYPKWLIALDNFARRLLDILVSAVGLLLLCPLLLFISILIKQDTPGPVFYRGRRVGKGGKEFLILKFRTMYEDPESYNGARLTTHDDPRITPFGRLLRDTKINELPQLWNVLVGQMSLVGPRPEDPEICADWPEDLRQKILSVRPGITSPASLMFFDEEKRLSSSQVKEDYLENILPFKLRLDINYLERRTILNDLDTIFLTAIALVPAIRIKRINEEVLEKGPIFKFFYIFLKWFIVDLIVSIFTVSFSFLLMRLSAPLNVGVLNALLLAFLMAGIFSVTNVILGINRVAWRHASAEATLDLGFSVALTTILIGILDAVGVFPLHFGPNNLVLMGSLSFLGFVITRYRTRILTGLANRWLSLRGHETKTGERVIIAGAGKTGLKASWFIKHGFLEKVFNIVGFVDDNPFRVDLIIDGSPVLGKLNDLPEIIAGHAVDTIILANSNPTNRQRQKLAALCEGTPVKIIDFNSLISSTRSFVGTNPQDPESLLNSKNLLLTLNRMEQYLNDNEIEKARELLAEAQEALRERKGTTSDES